ncbi:MAG: hypothetical protein D8M57_16735 [Candidatus Scalindua sp. AMX11]|nr:MAG: hypothetical protein DWQ00_00865 [Candidatus Scalindua sp.]NOG82986.1 hypothetical protein [Planctomycetota bacterium]RZV68040.1 MAG: hypothetical protein EX341_16720 [Candidatus Scalindua sp. SCAELEC01]TDE63731.1 MAG: hypothetical protein D8M57_16735 [Candidatus Scalindua sp. AMX11]GJQ60484.1 MAG: hypothetical protein SCALA701_32850 [Candidatus Scalindua sp.]
MQQKGGAIVKAILMAFFIGIGLLSSLCDVRAIGTQSELRGVWLNQYAFNSLNRQETLEKILQANLNTVFVISPQIEDNNGESDPDDFKAFIHDAKSRGLSVHGWICNHWRTDNRSTVNFADPKEQKAQVKWVISLLDTYPELDGVHFDYIRYEIWEKCNAVKMNGINETIRLANAAIKLKYPEKFLTATSFAAASASYHGVDYGTVVGWLTGLFTGEENLWVGDVPQWYQKWYAKNPDNWYSMRNTIEKDLKKTRLLGPEHFNFQQDPTTWIREGMVDAVIPMQYTSNDQTLEDEVNLWNSFVPDQSDKIYLGLGWLEEKDHNDWQYDPSAIVRHINYGRSKGIKGFVIFELTSAELPEGVDDWDLVRALSVDSEINNFQAPFSNRVPSPLSSTK